jgi:glycine C-acetyltransferase
LSARQPKRATATHTLEDVEITLNAFSDIREKLENGAYKRISELMMAGIS